MNGTNHLPTLPAQSCEQLSFLYTGTRESRTTVCFAHRLGEFGLLILDFFLSLPSQTRAAASYPATRSPSSRPSAAAMQILFVRSTSLSWRILPSSLTSFPTPHGRSLLHHGEPHTLPPFLSKQPSPPLSQISQRAHRSCRNVG